MAEYVDFRYMPLEGKITGKQVLKQTEDAINDLGQHVYEIDIDNEKIQEAIDTSNQAIETAEEALAVVTTNRAVWYNSVTELREAIIDNGIVAAIKGYAFAGDEGQAFYVVREKKSGDVDDGKTIIFLDAGNVAEIIANTGITNMFDFDEDGYLSQIVDGDISNQYGEKKRLASYEGQQEIVEAFNDVINASLDIKGNAESARTSAETAQQASDSLIQYLATRESITAPIVDPTLAISGAAADAKVTGDGLKPLLDVALTIPTPQNGYYTATIGETIAYTAQGVSRAYIFDCSAYVGYKVKVLYTTTATVSVRATAMCDADGVVLSAYQEKNMSNDGFVLDVTDEYNQLYVSFDTTYTTASSLVVTVLNGVAERVQKLQEDVVQIQAFDREVAERLSFEDDISGVEVPILNNSFGLKLFDIGGGKYRVNKRYKDFYSEALEGIEWVSVYLNPETGNNSNDGSKEHPIKTIATALGFIGNNIRIVVPAGDYSAFNSGIQGQVSNVSKNIIIECEDGIYRQRYGVLCSTRAWTETGSGVWQNSIASSPVNVVDGTTYYTNYSTLTECTANPQSYAHVSGVLYVHTADGTKPSAQFLEFSYPALVVNPQTNASVFAMNNVFLTDAVFDKGICKVEIKGDSTVTNYKSFTKNVKCNKITFGGYSGHNYYGYNVQVDGSPTLAQDGIAISRNSNVFLEKCYAKNCGADGYNYHNGVGTGTPLVVELECVGLNCGTELTATINNCSTLHENFRAIRIGGSYYNSRNRVVHDVNTSKSFNAFCYVRQLDRADNTTMDFSVGADNGDTAEMMIYNCNTDGSRSTYNVGVHNGTGNSIKCYGTHFERVQTSEQINMDWNPFA